MPAADAARSAAFYEAVFGWRTETPYQDFESSLVPRSGFPAGYVVNAKSTRTLATSLDPEGNPIGLTSHAVAPAKDN